MSVNKVSFRVSPYTIDTNFFKITPLGFSLKKRPS